MVSAWRLRSSGVANESTLANSVSLETWSMPSTNLTTDLPAIFSNLIFHSGTVAGKTEASVAITASGSKSNSSTISAVRNKWRNNGSPTGVLSLSDKVFFNSVTTLKNTCLSRSGSLRAYSVTHCSGVSDAVQSKCWRNSSLIVFPLFYL